MVKIKLTPAEMLFAANAGVMRMVENLKLGRQATYGSTSKDCWQRGVEGSLAECAFAKYKNIYYSGKGTCFGPDFQNHEEVRMSPLPHACLILHPEDKDESEYWLLTGLHGEYIIHGYLLGKDGKQDKYWVDKGNGRPAFFIPQSDLIPPE